MKIKMGFVTNSSSTSFVAWGVSYKVDDLKEILGEMLFAKFKHDNKNDKSHKTLEEFLESYNFLDDLDSMCDKLGLSFFDCNSDSCSLEIGKSPFLMKDNQTLLEFKKEIVEKLRELGLNNINENDLQKIEESWYDG